MSESLPDTASNWVPDTDAESTSVWGVPGAVIGIVTVSVSPAAIGPRSQVTVAEPEQEPAVVVTLPAREAFAGILSVSAASGSEFGPAFVTVSVYANPVPWSTLAGAEMLTPRSAPPALVTVVVAEEELSLGSGSVVDDETEAVFVMVPAAVAVVVIVTDAPPVLIAPRAHVTLRRSEE